MKRPVSIEFVLKGNLEKEVDRVRLSIQKMGTEGTKSYRTILNSSNQAFAGLSAGAQRQAVALQKVILSLKRTENVQESLKKSFENGNITAKQYAESSARLAAEQAQLKAQAAGLNNSLQKEIANNQLVKGSYNERVATLKQLKETYAQLSQEEINNAEIGGKMLEKIKKLQAENEKFEQSLKGVAATQATSINGMKSRLTELQNKYNSLSKAERNNANVGGKLARQMKKLKTDISKAENANKGFIDSLKSAPGPIGSTVSGMEQMTRAAMKFIATPLGAIIAALVVAFKALTVWFHRGSAGESAFAKVSGYFAQVLNTVLNIAAKVGEWLYKAFTSPKQALKDLVDFIKNQFINRFKAIGQMASALHEMFTGNWKQGLHDYANAWLQLGTGMQDVIGKTGDFIKKTDEAATGMAKIYEALYQQKRKNIDVDLEAKKISEEISRLRITAMDYYGGPEKVAAARKASEKIIELAKKRGQLEIDAAQKTYELTKEKYLLENKATDIHQLDIKEYKEIRDLEQAVIDKKVKQENLIRRIQGNLNSIIGREHALKDATQQTLAELKKKKTAYQRYYEYLSTTSKQEAQGMFSDLLKEGGSYLDYLNRKISEIRAKKTPSKDETAQLVVYTVEKKKITGGQSPVDLLKQEIEAKKKLYADDILAFRDYLKKKKEALKDDSSETGYKQKILIDVELDTSSEKYKKQLDAILAKYSNYTTKIAALTKSYQQEKKILEAAGTDEAKAALKNLTDAYHLAISQVNIANDDYIKTVFSDIGRMGIDTITRLLSQTREVIDSAKSKTVNGQTFMIVDIKSIDEQGKIVHKNVEMTLEEFQKLQNRYDQLYDAATQRNPFKAIGVSFSEMSKAIKDGDNGQIQSSVKKLGAAIAETGQYLNDLAGSFDQIFGTDIQDDVKFLTDMADGVSSLGVGIAELASGDIVDGAKDALKGLAKIVGTLIKGAKEYRDAQTKYLNEMIDFQLKYNAAIAQQIMLQKSGNVFIQDYVGSIRQAYLALAETDKNLAKLLQGKTIEQYLSEFTVKTGVAKKKFLGITIGSKDVFGNLLDQYPELIDAQGNLNLALAKTLLNLKDLPEDTKRALSALVEYQSEMKAATDQINSAISSMAGSISTDLYSALHDAWKAGTDSFKAFQDSVSKGMEQMISQMVYNQIFAGAFQQLQDNLKASFNPRGGDQSALDDFRKFMDQAPDLLKKWDGAMADLKESLQEAGISIAGLMDDMTGTTADNIASAIAQGFQNGYRSASDFAKTFQDLMKNAILKAMQVQILQKPLQAWMEKFQASMQNGNLADNMSGLNKDFNDIIAQAGDYIKAIERATGLDFGVNQQADKTGITTITEQTASKLEGNFIAVRINTANLAQSAQTIVSQMAINQLHLLAIERNTDELSRLVKIENSLKSLETDGIKIK